MRGTTTRQTMHDINKELEKFFQLLEEAESSTNEGTDSPERNKVSPSPDRNPSPPGLEASRSASTTRESSSPASAPPADSSTSSQTTAGRQSNGLPPTYSTDTTPTKRVPNPVPMPPSRSVVPPSRPVAPPAGTAELPPPVEPTRAANTPPIDSPRTATPPPIYPAAPTNSVPRPTDPLTPDQGTPRPPTKPYVPPRVMSSDARPARPIPRQHPGPAENRLPVPPVGKAREFPSTERNASGSTQSNLDQLMQEVRGKLNQPARPRTSQSPANVIPALRQSADSIVVDPQLLAEATKTPTWRRGVLTGLAIVLPACLALAILLNRPDTDFDFDTSSAIAQNANALPDEQAELSMTSSPPGARVFLDGELFGVTPFESVRIKPGTYNVTAELPGYASIDTTLTVRARHWIALNIPGADEDRFYAENGSEDEGHVLAGLESGDDAAPGLPESTVEPTATSRDDNSNATTSERQNSSSSERVERRPTPPRPTTGSIMFTSEPEGASVYLDNRRRGQTPLTLRNIPGGSHSVKYSLEGYQDYAVGLELTPGIQTPLHGQLQPAYGTVVLNVEATGTVFIDGTLMESDVSGTRTYQLEAGPHTIAVQRSGMKPWELDTTVKAGEAQTIVAEAPDSEFTNIFNQAEQQYAVGEYSAARDLFEQARTLQPDNRLVVGKLAEIDRLLEAEHTQELTEAIIENGVYLVTDTPPKLVGGLEELHKRVKYPEAAYQAGVTGRVYIQFVVNEDGSASDLTVTKGLPLGCNEEAMRAIQSARFEPATFDGRTVKARHTLFVNFGQK